MWLVALPSAAGTLAGTFLLVDLPVTTLRYVLGATVMFAAAYRCAPAAAALPPPLPPPLLLLLLPLPLPPPSCGNSVRVRVVLCCPVLVVRSVHVTWVRSGGMPSRS